MADQFAKTLGAIAFAKGIDRAPALDADFIRALNPEVGTNASALKAWLAGWTQACLAAPL